MTSTTHIPAARLRALALAVALSFVWANTALAQAPVSITTTGGPKPASSPAAGGDQRDVLILLDGGPLQLRLHMSLGGVSLAETRRKYIANLITSLDTDKDGKLSRAEAQKSPILRMKERPGAAQFLESLRAQTNLAARDVGQKIDALGGELVAYREDMSSSQNDLEIFKLLDADGSEVLESKEFQGAAELIVSKDEDADGCISFQEFFPPPPPPDPMAVAAGLVEAAPPTPIATVAKLIRNVNEPTLPERLRKKYDKNRDFHLDAAEIGWTKERLAALDADGNQKLDAAELTRLSEAAPDVEMVVDLKAPDTGGGLLSISETQGQRLDDLSRPDYAKLGFQPAVVTFSHRNLDPVAVAIDDAMRAFNALDLDANGYLDGDEVLMRLRFQRELFGLIDADGDGKLFADEMKAYVQARAEPSSTTCRLNLYDTGNGFFMALDTNADGRVSVREIRKAAGSLAQLDRDGQPGVAQKEPARHFHVEFVRGGYNLFGASEQLLALTPAFQQRTPTGPVWFQRMDRNNDGDLIFNEFFGPLMIFNELDADGDELLDPQEAGKSK